MELLNPERIDAQILEGSCRRKAVGLVFSPDALEELERQIEHASQVPNLTTLTYFGIPVYTDEDQQCDCLIFYDADLLWGYLKRGNRPYWRDFFNTMVETLQNRKE